MIEIHPKIVIGERIKLRNAHFAQIQLNRNKQHNSSGRSELSGVLPLVGSSLFFPIAFDILSPHK